MDLFWSDPKEMPNEDGKPTFKVGKRGKGYEFNSAAADEFCEKNNVKLIVRSHQSNKKGYEIFFKNRNCKTVKNLSDSGVFSSK